MLPHWKAIPTTRHPITAWNSAICPPTKQPFNFWATSPLLPHFTDPRDRVNIKFNSNTWCLLHASQVPSGATGLLEQLLEAGAGEKRSTVEPPRQRTGNRKQSSPELNLQRVQFKFSGGAEVSPWIPLLTFSLPQKYSPILHLYVAGGRQVRLLIPVTPSAVLLGQFELFPQATCLGTKGVKQASEVQGLVSGEWKVTRFMWHRGQGRGGRPGLPETWEFSSVFHKCCQP